MPKRKEKKKTFASTKKAVSKEACQNVSRRKKKNSLKPCPRDSLEKEHHPRKRSPKMPVRKNQFSEEKKISKTDSLENKAFKNTGLKTQA